MIRPKNDTMKVSTPDKAISLVNLEDSQIQKIVLKSKNRTLTFTKKNQDWASNLSFPLKRSEIESLSYTFAGLQAEQLLDESPSDLEQYGLDSPLITIEVTTTTQETKVMYLGDLAPSGASYYFKLQNNPAVYTIANYNGDKFRSTPADFRDPSLAKIDVQSVSYFKLSRAGKPDLEIQLNTDTSEFAQYGIGIWQMTKPYQEPKSVVTDKFQPILESITSITNAEEFIDENPSDLNRYGLANPQAEVVIKDKQSQFRLLIGKPINDTAFYCKKPDSNAIFTINSNNLYFLDTQPFDLVEKFAFIVNIDDVDKIEVSGLGSNHTMVITRKQKSPKSKITTNYQVDGKRVKESLFKTIYQTLISLQVESEGQIQPSKISTFELKMIFYLNKGPQRKIDIEYVPYDYDFYMVYQSGKGEFLISKDQVNKAIQDLETLIKSK